jgi:hypothetical protein
MKIDNDKHEKLIDRNIEKHNLNREQEEHIKMCKIYDLVMTNISSLMNNETLKNAFSKETNNDVKIMIDNENMTEEEAFGTAFFTTFMFYVDMFETMQ